MGWGASVFAAPLVVFSLNLYMYFIYAAFKTGSIIGPQGTRIRAIRAQSGAQIIIGKAEPGVVFLQ